MAPFEHRYLLYLMHTFFAFTSRMWDMGIVLLIAHVTNNNMAIVALSGFLSTVSIFLFMGYLGRYLDATNRLTAAYMAVFMKIISVSLAYLVGVVLADETAVNPKLPRLVYVLPCLGAVASMSFSTITQSVEKDWIVVLSDKSSAWLGGTNSVMSQIDLGCASLAPALAGFLFSSFSLSHTAVILLLTNATSAACLLYLLHYLYYAYPALALRDDRLDSKVKSAKGYAAIGSSDDDSIPTPSASSCTSCLLKFLSLEEFAECGCAMVMLGYAFLYCTAMSFGALMTVYLRFAGMTDMTIGVFRGINAFMGLLGAMVFPYVAARIGLWNASQMSILYQLMFVLLGAGSFFVEYGIYGAYVLATAVLMSRTGLWMFDLGVRQIAQETIPEAYRGERPSCYLLCF